MSYNVQKNAKCKPKVINMSITHDDDSFDGSDETLSNLTEQVKCMSNFFEIFYKQLSDVLNYINELKGENKCLKETNC